VGGWVALCFFEESGVDFLNIYIYIYIYTYRQITVYIESNLYSIILIMLKGLFASPDKAVKLLQLETSPHTLFGMNTFKRLNMETVHLNFEDGPTGDFFNYIKRNKARKRINDPNFTHIPQQTSENCYLTAFLQALYGIGVLNDCILPDLRNLLYWYFPTNDPRTAHVPFNNESLKDTIKHLFNVENIIQTRANKMHTPRVGIDIGYATDILDACNKGKLIDTTYTIRVEPTPTMRSIQDLEDHIEKNHDNLYIGGWIEIRSYFVPTIFGLRWKIQPQKPPNGIELKEKTKPRNGNDMIINQLIKRIKDATLSMGFLSIDVDFIEANQSIIQCNNFIRKGNVYFIPMQDDYNWDHEICFRVVGKKVELFDTAIGSNHATPITQIKQLQFDIQNGAYPNQKIFLNSEENPPYLTVHFLVDIRNPDMTQQKL
jgi:hypothetical protein